MPQVSVTDAPARSRFELSVDGVVTSVVYYSDVDSDVRVFPHTETLPSHGGTGYGTQVVLEALRMTVAEGRKISPACGFVRHVVAEHPEFQSSVV